MATTRTAARRRFFRLGHLLIVALIVGGTAWGIVRANRPARITLDGLPYVQARRADIRSTIQASGETESLSNTTIECELERIEMRSEGRSTTAGGASTVLWVVPDGTMVEKGAVLCTLDSSDYEEMVLQQQIKVDRAKSDLVQAKLDLEATELSVNEFRGGLKDQTFQECEGKLKLAESDLQRARDRVEWTKRMTEKDYVPATQLTSDLRSVMSAELALTKARWAIENFRKFGAPKEDQGLRADVETARGNLVLAERKFERFQERLDHYRKMVESCTIKAPHDGFVIYANPKRWFSSNVRIEPGTTVRQYQELFYLPDLSKMQVNALVHESVMARIRPGQRVRAKIEGLANRELEGSVVKIDPLPDTDAGWLSETKFFRAHIKLDHIPMGIRPEMTAEVDIDVDRRLGVVSLPPEALSIVDGKDYCYVKVDDILERRQVTLGQSSRELLEIVDGIDEGEDVVADITGIERYESLVVDAEPRSGSTDTPVVAADRDPTHSQSQNSKAGL